MAQERLQKILAAAGVASRRKAEELITAGRVSVNGEPVTELGSKADARADEIRVDGQLLRGRERHVYIALHKPKGYVTTVSDPEGRPTVMELLEGVEQRIFPVGRLDYASEGLLLLTNDGTLMQQLTNAASHIAKSYMVKISGMPSEEQLDRLRAGIFLPAEHSRAGTLGGTRRGMARRSEAVRTQAAGIELAKEQENPWYRVTLTEGRNRQIRRMFEQIGHHVEKIRRVRYGPLELDLEPGQWRFLKPREVDALRHPKPERVAADSRQPAQARRSPASRREPAKPARNFDERRGGARGLEQPFASRREGASTRGNFGAAGRARGGGPQGEGSGRRPFGKARGRSERPPQQTQQRRLSGTPERGPSRQPGGKGRTRGR
jgi:23S rRNA pseudouridine2605 synthase